MVTNGRAGIRKEERPSARPLERLLVRPDVVNRSLDVLQASGSDSACRLGLGGDAVDVETLDGDFYRERALLCHNLAESAKAARPLFTRLHFLARVYENKAAAADRDRASSQQREFAEPTRIHWRTG